MLVMAGIVVALELDSAPRAGLAEHTVFLVL
jgi:hypothetical protein